MHAVLAEGPLPQYRMLHTLDKLVVWYIFNGIKSKQTLNVKNRGLLELIN